MTNPFLRMESHKGDFTQNDEKIYESIVKSPDQVTYLSTAKLAQKVGVSQPALTRFIKGLGYARFQDFRSDMTTWLARQKAPRDPNRLAYFERLESLLAEAEQVLTDELLVDMATYIAGSRRVFATGIGKSMHPALLMQELYRKHGMLVQVCPLDMLHDYVDHMDKDDLLVAFSVSGNAELMDKVVGCRGRVLLVTANAHHAYAQDVSRTLVVPHLPPDPEACPVSPILFDMVVEMLDEYLSRVD